MQNISAKMVAVMKECAHVLKNGTNNFHGYKYATSSDVLEKVNAALVQNGISSMAMPELINCIDVTNTKGNKEHLATVKITITLTDSTSGESVTIVGLGSGQDAGDKAVMKAQTAAIKYAYLLSLNISTGDDPEADLQTDQNFSNENQSTHYSNPAQTPYKAPFPVGEQASCAECGRNISEKVRGFSESRYGKPLCMHCQQKRQETA